ncbi:30S ribosomal protein S11 [Patescibacteria group bacterium]
MPTSKGNKGKKVKKEKKGKKAKKKKKKKEIKRIPIGKAYIQATYNNTIVTLADLNGNVICSSSAGRLGFKGAKKATPYAASIIVKDVIVRSKECGLQSVSVFVKGVGSGRESAVRALNANGLNIICIKDVTPIPHNGCRPKKPRRI